MKKMILTVAALLFAGSNVVLAESAAPRDSFKVAINFRVNMGVLILQGKFNPATDKVTVAGSMNGWNAAANELTRSSTDDNLFEGVVIDGATYYKPGGKAEFKFVRTVDGTQSGWEGGDNKVVSFTGEEEVLAGDTLYVEATANALFFDGVTFNDIFTAANLGTAGTATVNFEVDTRPVYYHLADSGFVRADIQTNTDPQTSITGFYVNGPVFTIRNNWESWGAGLAVPEYKLVDDGTNGDATAGDSIFTFTKVYRVGDAVKGAGKLSVNGYDNENGFGGDHRVLMADQPSQRIRVIFGAARQNDGKYRMDLYSQYVDTTGGLAKVRRRPVTEEEPTPLDSFKVAINFRVNMGVLILQGRFNPATDKVTVAGSMNGWNAAANELTRSSTDDNVFEGIVVDGATYYKPGGKAEFKFVRTVDGTQSGWEGGDNKVVMFSGLEEVYAGDTLFVEATANPLFFDGVTFNDIFTAANLASSGGKATVNFEVDARPVYYYLADKGIVPNDVQTGSDGQTSISGFYVNGPVFTIRNNWESWGAGLAVPEYQLVDDGATKGDAFAGDTVYTFQKIYNVGDALKGAGKLSVNGFDNENGFGGDHRINMADAPIQRIKVIFGAARQDNGKYRMDLYSQYIDTTGGVARVRRATSNEDGRARVDAYELLANYPNPFNPATSIRFRTAAAGRVSLEVYNILGQKVATLLNNELVQAGEHVRSFDAKGLSSGMYIYRLSANGFVSQRKMTLLK